MSAESTPLFDQMKFDYDVAASAYDEATKKLAGAIDAAKASSVGNTEWGDQQIAAIREAQELVAGAIEKVAAARGSAHDAAYDAPSVKLRKAEIVACVKQIASWEKHLLKLDTAADKQVKAEGDQIDKQYEDEDDFAELVVRADKLAVRLDESQATLRAALDASYANACKHVARRDAEGLKLDTADADELSLKEFEGPLGELANLVEKVEKLRQVCSTEVIQRHMRELGRSRSRSERFASDLAYLKDRKKTIKAMKVVPVDIAKAIKTLGVPTSCKDAVAKALAETDDARRAKALGEVAKKAKLDQSGKDMLAALRDAKVV
jgi:hypothetical protein